MFLLVTSGRGPVECQVAVVKIVQEILAEAKNANIKADLVDQTESQYGMMSALISLEGEGIEAFAQGWQGTILWVWKSTIRPNHARKNWFAGVSIVPRRPELADVNMKDLRFETFRAGGAGGQHQNTTDSAVRITHMPTGITALARDERSQHRNRQIAMARLHQAFFEKDQAAAAGDQKSQWDNHNSLERGNPTRKYDGEKFRRVN